ncbi:MAG: phytoene/squalene synthase family protein [Opitutales bacterium]
MSPFLQKRLPRDWPALRPSEDWYRSPHLRESLAVCRQMTRKHAASFYFSSFPLPPARKQAAFAIYAFCRWVDDCIDETDLADGPDADELREEVTALLNGRSDLAFGPAFRAAVREYGIPEELFGALVSGCCRDRLAVRLNSFQELEAYCYDVASVVGLMMSRVFGLETREGMEQAVDMGIAMQLTNILRDVREDYEMGRVYLPADELAAHDLDIHDLAQGRVDERWRGFMRFQITRAREYFRLGSCGLPLLRADGSRFCARLMARIYAGILDEIERRDYDVFSSRAYVRKRRKIRITLRTLAA